MQAVITQSPHRPRSSRCCIPFYRRGAPGLEKLSNLPKFTLWQTVVHKKHLAFKNMQCRNSYHFHLSVSYVNVNSVKTC